MKETLLLTKHMRDFPENSHNIDVYEKNIRSQKSVMKLGGILNKINSNKHEYILTKKEWSNWDSN